MDIVLVHLGVAPCEYLVNCVNQIRKCTDDNVVVVADGFKGWNFDKKVIFVGLPELERTDNWNNFNDINFFPIVSEGDTLWRYSCERFFVIEAVMKHLDIESVLHLENDNLIYHTPDLQYLRDVFKGSIGLTEINSHYLSAGVIYIDNIDVLGKFNSGLNNLMEQGKEQLLNQYAQDTKKEMANEMWLMNVLSGQCDFIKLLPIFPDNNSKYVYDCASWGQYVGGAFHKPGVPHYEDAHYIGRKIKDGTYKIEMIDSQPYVVRNRRNKWPLFNLHIHSKDLKRWM
jgi:hypothetical protein